MRNENARATIGHPVTYGLPRKRASHRGTWAPCCERGGRSSPIAPLASPGSASRYFRDRPLFRSRWAPLSFFPLAHTTRTSLKNTPAAPNGTAGTSPPIFNRLQLNYRAICCDC